jgi:hypothetical protein
MAKGSCSSGIDTRLIGVLVKMARCLLEAEHLPNGSEVPHSQGESAP